MDLASYFKETEGVGILGTCDPQQQVDLALYSRPVVIDETTIALVMKHRHSHQNLQDNLKAAYLFLENGPGYKGLRMHLTKQREEKNQSLIELLRQKEPTMFPKGDDSAKHLVFFTVDQIRSLTGDASLK